jgi:hypothetical protein
MNIPAYVRVAPFLLAGLLVTACGKSSTSPSQTTGNSAITEVRSAQGVVSTAVSVAGGVIPTTAVAPSANGCPYDSGTGRFVCSSTSVSGLTLSGWYELLDAAGHRQSAFDSAITASIHTVMDMSGTIATGTSLGTVTTTRHSDQTLSGLLTNTHTLNGTGTSTTSYPLAGGTTSFTEHDTINNLVLATGTGAGQWPQSGSITTALDFGGTGLLNTQMTLTFNGTSIATVTMTPAGGATLTCTLDLANPGALGSCH